MQPKKKVSLNRYTAVALRCLASSVRLKNQRKLTNLTSTVGIQVKEEINATLPGSNSNLKKKGKSGGQRLKGEKIEGEREKTWFLWMAEADSADMADNAARGGERETLGRFDWEENTNNCSLCSSRNKAQRFKPKKKKKKMRKYS